MRTDKKNGITSVAYRAGNLRRSNTDPEEFISAPGTILSPTESFRIVPDGEFGFVVIACVRFDRHPGLDRPPALEQTHGPRPRAARMAEDGASGNYGETGRADILIQRRQRSRPLVTGRNR